MTRHWHAPPDFKNSETFATLEVNPRSSTTFMASMFSDGKITVSSITTALQASSLASLSDTGISSNNSENEVKDLSLKAFG